MQTIEKKKTILKQYSHRKDQGARDRAVAFGILKARTTRALEEAAGLLRNHKGLDPLKYQQQLRQESEKSLKRKLRFD